MESCLVRRKLATALDFACHAADSEINSQEGIMTENDSQVAGFEKNLDKLEKIVQELESGELGLEKSLEKFEKGVALYKGCKDQLAKAEKKIQMLTEQLDEEDLT